MNNHPRIFLKLSGFSSLAELEDDVSSVLVDIGYIAKKGDGYVLIAPDDSDEIQLHVSKDYEWFERVVLSSLQRHDGPLLTASPFASLENGGVGKND